MAYIFFILVIATTLFLLRVFRAPIQKWAYKMRAKLNIHSLRTAIEDADKNKQKTGRKTMVVFNTSTGSYEPLEKKILKAASNAGKRKNNSAMTEGRKRMMNAKKERVFTPERVKQIQQKSLYVTN